MCRRSSQTSLWAALEWKPSLLSSPTRLALAASTHTPPSILSRRVSDDDVPRYLNALGMLKPEKMPTTRRSNGMPSGRSTSSPASSPVTASRSTKSSTPPIPPPTHSPYLPTRTEALLLFVYPLTLLLGSLFTYLSPPLRPPANAATYSEIHQSYQPPSAAPSYFAQKRNVFNVYFVKIGWFWCTLAFAVFTAFVAKGRNSIEASAVPDSTASARTSRRTDRERRDAADQRVRRYWQSLLRYGAATLFWIATTQWFLGPALVDRGFALTGGVCEVATEKLAELELQGGSEAADRQKREVARAVSHAACRVAGGMWKGGYDISGHVFLLVLGSGMLWFEMLPFLLPRVKGLGLGRVLRTEEGRDWRVGNEMLALGDGSSRSLSGFDGTGDEKDVSSTEGWALKEFATALALGVVALCLWMLLMTAAFFHTWFEKLTGWIWAFFALWVIYLLPRGQPGMRNIMGLPGL